MKNPTLNQAAQQKIVQQATADYQQQTIAKIIAYGNKIKKEAKSLVGFLLLFIILLGAVASFTTNNTEYVSLSNNVTPMPRPG